MSDGLPAKAPDDKPKRLKRLSLYPLTLDQVKRGARPVAIIAILHLIVSVIVLFGSMVFIFNIGLDYSPPDGLVSAVTVAYSVLRFPVATLFDLGVIPSRAVLGIPADYVLMPLNSLVFGLAAVYVWKQWRRRPESPAE